MKDRIPTYPGRVKLVPVTGQQNVFDMERADSPIEEGTPLNKATLLSDNTAKALGLKTEDDPTVDDALKAVFNQAGVVILDGFFTSQATAKTVAVTSLSVARRQLAATTIGDYALFGGGDIDNTYMSAVVDAYNKERTRTSPTSLSEARRDLAATTVSGYALFGGGYRPYGRKNTVDAYDADLTRTTPTPLSVARDILSATTVGGYALFGGGMTGSASNVVDAYDAELTRTTPAQLSVARYMIAAASVGDYAIFGSGGNTSSYAGDAFDVNFTRTQVTFTEAKAWYAATSVGNYALFAGGSVIPTAFNKSLTRSQITNAIISAFNLAATTLGKYAIFAGGAFSSSTTGSSAEVRAYDENLVSTSLQGLHSARSKLAATAIGDYALFGGGYKGDSSTSYSDVDSVSFPKHAKFSIPPMSKYRFNGIHSAEQFTPSGVNWDADGALTGYIKVGGFTLTGLVSST